jgi:hypothetical protein
LARHLRAEGIAITEVGRPKRQRRARYGKSDDADAAGAAAIVLAGEALGEPKSADGAAEMVRALRVARTSAVRARAKAYTALQTLHRSRNLPRPQMHPRNPCSNIGASGIKRTTWLR